MKRFKSGDQVVYISDEAVNKYYSDIINYNTYLTVGCTYTICEVGFFRNTNQYRVIEWSGWYPEGCFISLAESKKISEADTEVFCNALNV